MRCKEREKRLASNATTMMNKATDWRTSKVITGTGRPEFEPAIIFKVRLMLERYWKLLDRPRVR
jgi:hypothetical protein